MKKLVTSLLVMLFSLTATAETYKFYVSNQAGTGPDAFVRKLTAGAEKISPHKFVVINKTGGDFMIGYRAFEADKSGKALYLSLITTHILPYVTKNDLHVDPLNDTQPVIMGVKLNYLLVVPNDSAIKNAKDIKGKMNIGYSGNLAPVLLSTLGLDPDVQFIPYKSDTDAAIPLLKNEIQVGQFISISVPRTYAKELRVIGDFNDVLSGFLGVHATNEMSTAEVYELNKIFNTVMSTKEFQEYVHTVFGSVVIGGQPDYFGRELNMYKTRLAKIVNR